MLHRLALAILLAIGLGLGVARAQQERQTPYWASIASGKAMMRTGPGRNYPATWLYVRADLPVKVVDTYPDWRKVQDPAGETGWMLQRLLSDTRTALVTGGVPQLLRESPNVGARMVYRAEPGVVGRVSHCASGWCRLDVGGRKGYIRTESLWGVDPRERID